TLWTFSKARMNDSGYSFPRGGGKTIEFKVDDFPVSLAVACSTAVPFPFNPVKIKKKYLADPKDMKIASPALMDGGIYDNQGIHKLTQEKSSYKCDVVICSDGSGPIKREFRGINPLPVLNRVVSLMMRRIKAMQFIRNVYEKESAKVKEIAYFSLDWEYDKCLEGFVNAIEHGDVDQEILDKLKIPKSYYSDKKRINRAALLDFLRAAIGYERIISQGLTKREIEEVAEIGTNLTALTERQIDILSKHASALTEIQVKLYCPSLVVT
ncbi:MAG: patatin-like phospholipase family protein, partial [bacterium]|nr:patatin-like phospholipase family protein [bacterium]